MKRILATCFLVGFAFVFLTGKPTKAYACGTCDGAACAYYGDIFCSNEQYTYPASEQDVQNQSCCGGIPDGCWSGSGGWLVQYIEEGGTCQDNGGQGCQCPLDPNQFFVYSSEC